MIFEETMSSSKSSDASSLVNPFARYSSGSGRSIRSPHPPDPSFPRQSPSIDNLSHKSLEASPAVPVSSHHPPTSVFLSEKSSDFKAYHDSNLASSSSFNFPHLTDLLNNSSLRDSSSQEPFDLVTARNDFKLCKTAEERSALKKMLRPKIVKRLKELSEMEMKSNVGVEIAETVDFLKELNYPDLKLEKLGEISQTTLKGVLHLNQGLDLMKKSLDLLQSALQNSSPSFD